MQDKNVFDINFLPLRISEKERKLRKQGKMLNHRVIITKKEIEKEKKKFEKEWKKFMKKLGD